TSHCSLSSWGPRHDPQTPNVRSAPAKLCRSSIDHGGPDMAPKPPTFGAPGEAVSLLYPSWGPRHGPTPPNARSAPAKPCRSSIDHRGPDMAPKPPTFGAPRRSRVAPLSNPQMLVACRGTRDAPRSPQRL